MGTKKSESTRFSIALPGDLRARLAKAAPSLGLRDTNSVIGFLLAWALAELAAGRVFNPGCGGAAPRRDAQNGVE
jgi:hypothetical protein